MDGFGHAMKDRTKLQLHGLTSPAWKPAEIIKKIAQKKEGSIRKGAAVRIWVRNRSFASEMGRKEGYAKAVCWRFGKIVFGFGTNRIMCRMLRK